MLFRSGAGYEYAHDFEAHIVEQEHLPEELRGRRYYEPSAEGEEASVRDRLELWQKKRK